jgi:hypothetical protein
MWKLLAEKGKISTIIGLVLSFPINGYALFAFFTKTALTQDQLWQIVIVNAVGMVWFILPSTIRIKGKGFEVEVID